MMPMLAKIGNEEYLSKPGYIYEPKLDGIRAILYYGKKGKQDKKDALGRNAVFKSRNGKDLTSRFSSIKLPAIKATSCIIDGEIVAYDSKGNPNFHLLQNGKDADYVAFDIVEKDGKDLRMLPLMERKAILQATLSENDDVQTMFYTERGRKLWESMKKRGAEGVVAKKKDSLYQEGVRSDSWLKIKLLNTVDSIIIGFTQSKRKLSSLALGLYDNGKISFVGKVGTGFDSKFIDDFYPKLMKIKGAKAKSKSEKKAVLLPAMPREIIAVKPHYIAEVEYLEFTPDRKLRAPVFKRLREDKKISECTFPEISSEIS